MTREPSPYHLTVGGIEMSAQKKQIKNMYIRVVPPDGEVRITAPFSATDDAIKEFALSHIGWIQKQQQKIAAQPQPSERRYVTGESCYLWGKPYRLEVVPVNTRNRVSINGQRIILQARRDSTPQQRAKVLDSWYREILKAAIPPVLERCERQAGVKAKEWQVKNMRTKWGTCNVVARRIWLNLQLVKKTPECLEYVIMHELVHLLEKSHNHIFKAHMDRLYPHWRTVKATLNDHMPD